MGLLEVPVLRLREDELRELLERVVRRDVRQAELPLLPREVQPVPGRPALHASPGPASETAPGASGAPAAAREEGVVRAGAPVHRRAGEGGARPGRRETPRASGRPAFDVPLEGEAAARPGRPLAPRGCLARVDAVAFAFSLALLSGPLRGGGGMALRPPRPAAATRPSRLSTTLVVWALGRRLLPASRLAPHRCGASRVGGLGVLAGWAGRAAPASCHRCGSAPRGSGPSLALPRSLSFTKEEVDLQDTQVDACRV